MSSPKPLDFRVFSQFGDLDASVWERLTANATVFMKRPFLLALEDAQPDSVQPRYGLLYDDDEPVVALAGQLLTVQVDRAAPGGQPDGALARLAQSALEHVDIDIALWGNFLTWGHCGVAFAPSVDEAALWPRAAEAIYRARRQDPGLRSADLYLLLDVPPHQVVGATHLENHGFDAFETEPDMVLELDPDWRSFEDYLGALKSKYRKASLEMDEELAEGGCVIERLVDVDGHGEELYELYHQVHERSPHRFVTLKKNAIPALARRLGDDFICNVVRQDDRLLGFGTTIIRT